MDADSISNTDEKFVSSSHAKGSLEKMRDLFMSQKLIDVTLVVSNVEITAHRLVLSSASDYFRAMFTGDLLEGNMARVQMEGTDPVALQALVNFCYSGEIDLSEDNVETVLATANVLQITEVKSACCNFLATHLNPSNCIGFSLISESQGCMELHQVAHTYVMDHFTDVIVNEEYLSLPAEEVKKLLLSRYMLNVPSEEEAFQSLMLWVNYDLPNRKNHLPYLFKFFKLPLLTPQDFDLCAACYDEEGFGLDDESAAWDVNQPNLQESRRFSTQRLNLVHFCQCEVANCPLPSCQGLKRIVQHKKRCKRKIRCPVCKHLVALCCYHAKHCQKVKCPLPYCLNVKKKLQQRRQQARIKRLIATRTNRGMSSAVFQTSPGSFYSSSQLSHGAPASSFQPATPLSQQQLMQQVRSKPPTAAQLA